MDVAVDSGLFSQLRGGFEDAARKGDSEEEGKGLGGEVIARIAFLDAINLIDAVGCQVPSVQRAAQPQLRNASSTSG